MISEVYTAFLSVGVSQSIAQKAAEALSSESLATKSDISNLDKKIDASISNLDKKIDAVNANLDKKIDTVRIELEKKIDVVKVDLLKEIHTVKTDVAVIKWMMGFVIAGITSLVIKTFF